MGAIYEEQPQMLEAARADGWRPSTSATTQLRAAFAAIDREALLEHIGRQLGDKVISPPPGCYEQVLVAAGVLPPR